MGIDSVYLENLASLPSIAVRSVIKSTFQEMLIGHAKWKPVSFPSLHSIEEKLEC